MSWLNQCAAAALVLLGGLASPSLGQAILAVERDQVNIRADATVQSIRVAVLRRGEEVEELVRHNEWVQVRLADGRSGWVHSQLVQPRLVVEGQGVRVRATASSQSASLVMLYRGQEVGKIGERGNWLEVRLSDGRTGWAYGRYLRAKTAADAQALTPTLPEAGAAGPPPESLPEVAASAEPVRVAVARVTEGAAPPGPAVAVPVADAVEVPAEIAREEFALVRRNPYVAGLQHEAAGESDRALARFEEVLSTDSVNVNALFHAAKAHSQLGQLDEAMGKLTRALKISGGRKDLYLTLGEVYRLRGEADSAAKYQALFRGEEPPATEAPAAVVEREGDGERSLPLAKLSVAAGLLIFLVGLGVWWARRKPASTRPGGARGDRRGRGKARFERALEQESAATQEGKVTPEEDRELDRQIEDKWRELRQSADLFSSTPAAQVGEGEEGNLNRLLDQVEALRRGLDLQDERAQIYADIVRLQNMKIEAMREELRLRGRRR